VTDIHVTSDTGNWPFMKHPVYSKAFVNRTSCIIQFVVDIFIEKAVFMLSKMGSTVQKEL
jgi:hypothetical protein